jgi:hypothetical protein
MIENSRPKLFSLPEYDSAQSNFIYRGVQMLMKARDEIFASIPSADPAEAVPTMQNTMPSGEVVQSKPVELISEFTFQYDAIKSCDTDAEVAIMTGKKLFRHYALELWNTCSRNFLDSDTILRAGWPPAGFVTYPVRCLTVVEILSMLALLRNQEDQSLSAEIADYLSEFVAVNEGAAHPISDRWGISVVCCTLELAIHHKTEVLRRYLRAAVKWIAYHYDQGELGLAGPYSSPEEETGYLLGSPFEHVDLQRRDESYIATQLLDLCAVLEEGELYDLARNEFLAVHIYLPVLEFDDCPAHYCVASAGQRYEPNVVYEETWDPLDEWKVAPHHKRGPDFFYPESTGSAWDQMAISCVTRDRHFVRTWRRLLRAG